MGPFENVAEDYDRWYDTIEGAAILAAELECLRTVAPQMQGNWLEIGVGTGRFAGPLGIPIGVEPSPQMAKLARQRRIEVLEGRAEDLPLAANSFDFAVMVTVVCFLDDVAKAFKEVFRILKPNGTLVVGFIDRESALGMDYSQKKDQSRFYRDATFYSVSELEALLSEADFSNFNYRQTLLPGETTGLTVREGHGYGGFVVIKAHKTEKRSEA